MQFFKISFARIPHALGAHTGPDIFHLMVFYWGIWLHKSCGEDNCRKHKKAKASGWDQNPKQNSIIKLIDDCSLEYTWTEC